MREPQQPESVGNTDELFERIERDWTRLRQSVGERNKVAEIMLTEAKPLGFDGDVLVVGHHTGALAERINAEKNNADIAAVLSEKLGSRVGVRCVVGTDPAAANLRRPAKREVWTPPEQGGDGSSDGDDPAPAGGWDEPAPIGQPEPAEPAQPETQRQDDWRAAAQAASQKAAEKAKRERDEIPPPPEPVDFEEEEPEASIREVAPYSREDEERDMAEQARDEEGSADRRDATQVAMDLLAQELGAKPL